MIAEGFIKNLLKTLVLSFSCKNKWTDTGSNVTFLDEVNCIGRGTHTSAKTEGRLSNLCSLS